GQEFYAYGGDFGEKLHDGNFALNGIVAADGRPKAAIHECKRVYQPVECELLPTPDRNGTPPGVSAAAQGNAAATSLRVRVINRHASLPLSGYVFTMVLKEDGKVVYNK